MIQNKTTTEVSENWIMKTGVQWGSEWERVNPLKDYTLLKVYNPNMGSTPDKELDWTIVKLSPDDGWVPFAKTLENVKVITITKCFKWYASKLEDWKPVKDDNWKAVSELYYTPEVNIYDKSNIALAKSTSKWPKVLGKGWFQSYIEFTTSMQLADWTLNPLFSTIGTNSQTWDKYPISIMKQEYFMYFEMEGTLYKIRLWASYGRWKDVQPWTFLSVKEEWVKAFKETYPTMRFEHYYLTLNAKVEATDKYKFLSWEFASITKDSIIDTLTKTNEDIQSFNENGFPWISIDNQAEALSYDMNRLTLETSEKVATILEWKWEEADEEWISISDVPF